MATHLDVRHACEKELKCCGCDEVLRTEEYSARSLHFSRNKKCREGSKMFIGIEPPVTEVLGEWKPRAGVSQKELEKDKAEHERTKKMLQVKNELNERRRNWELESCRNFIERRCVN